MGIGTNSASVQSTLAAVPYSIVFDRTYVHGHATKGQIRCISLNGRDVEINAQALPVLRQETLAKQSADIDAVSGATVTSDGYKESLQSALDAAKLK